MIFLLIGLSVGTLGTLVGAGGGFLLIPILIYYFPTLGPSNIAATSMLAVCANAMSGSVAYSLKGQIHWRSALLFTLAAIPGVFLGTALNSWVNRKSFVLLFGVLIIALSIYIFKKSIRKDLHLKEKAHLFIFDNKKAYLGAGISVFVGMISSFLGIGGGIIHVPLLGTVLNFPIHLAAGTSHFILAASSAFAVFDHWSRNNYRSLDDSINWMLAGIIIGAQMGAALSKHVDSHKILKILSIALLIGGIRLCLY